MLSTTSKSASNPGLQTPTISGLVSEPSPYGLGLVLVLTPIITVLMSRIKDKTAKTGGCRFYGYPKI